MTTAMHDNEYIRPLPPEYNNYIYTQTEFASVGNDTVKYTDYYMKALNNWGTSFSFIAGYHGWWSS